MRILFHQAEPYVLELELDGLTRMANRSGERKGHWGQLRRETKKRHETIGWIIRPRHRPAVPLKRARLTCTRHSSSMPDGDGIAHGFKATIDGLVKAGVLEDDSYGNIGMPRYRYEPAPAGAGKLTVRIEAGDPHA